MHGNIYLKQKLSFQANSVNSERRAGSLWPCYLPRITYFITSSSAKFAHDTRHKIVFPVHEYESMFS
jgi:hypothetical protein